MTPQILTPEGQNDPQIFKTWKTLIISFYCNETIYYIHINVINFDTVDFTESDPILWTTTP